MSTRPPRSDSPPRCARLPLFPLPNVVLFPHALLPLHIFEDRYRAMMRDILAGERFLAMGLIAEREPDDERPAVAPIAGVGEVVMAHELPDGRFNLVVRGPRACASTRARVGSPVPAGHRDGAPRHRRRRGRRAARRGAGAARADRPARRRDPRGRRAAAPGGRRRADADGAGRRRRRGADRRTRRCASSCSRRSTSASGIERIAAEIVAMTARLAAPGVIN